MSEPQVETAEEYAARQTAEYSKFVAAVAINHDGVRAYNIGDPVPASNVDAHGYLDAGWVRPADEPAPEPSTPEPVVPPQGEPVVVNPKK